MPPANDAYADAQVVSLPFSGTFDLIDATMEPGEYMHPDMDYFDRSVWYEFTLAADAEISIVISNATPSGEYDIAMELFTDEGFSESDFLIGSYYNADAGVWLGEITHNLPAGTYRLQILGGTNWGSGGDLDITTGSWVAPTVANDHYTDPIVIPSLPYSTTQDTTGSGPADRGWPYSLGNIHPAPYYWLIHDVWYSLTLASDTYVTVDLMGSNYDSIVAIWRASDLVCFTTNDDRSDDPAYASESKVYFVAEAGVEYLIQIGGYGEGIADIDVTGGAIPTQPANNTMADAIELPSTFSVDLTNATDHPDDLRPPGSEDGAAWPLASVWYQFDVASETAVAIEISTENGLFSAVAVFEDGEFVDVDDTTLNFVANAGSSYMLKVGTWDGLFDTVDGTFSTTVVSPLTNDSRADAMLISGDTEHSVVIDPATTEADEPNPGFAIYKTIWYRFSPSEDMYLTVGRDGTQFSTRAAIWDETFSTVLHTVNSVPLTYVLEANTTVYLQYGSWFSSGTGLLSLQFDLIPVGDTSTPLVIVVDGDGNPIDESVEIPPGSLQYSFTTRTPGVDYHTAYIQRYESIAGHTYDLFTRYDIDGNVVLTPVEQGVGSPPAVRVAQAVV